MNDDVALIKTHHLALAERLVANDIANLNGIELLARRTDGSGRCTHPYGWVYIPSAGNRV